MKSYMTTMSKQIAYYIAGLESIKKKRMRYSNSFDELKKALSILCLLEPKDALESPKIRLGGDRDGGYVMLDPGFGGIAYSVGISDYSPWDLEMAERNFQVFQYDGTVQNEPDKHPNIFFHKYNISPSGTEKPDCRTIEHILKENEHADLYDIILQIDIEGTEWEFFKNISISNLLRFKQIIVEFHDVFVDSAHYHLMLDVLRKLKKTHQVVHTHGNNHGTATHFSDTVILLPQSIEVTFARKKSETRSGFTFMENHDFYPGRLDRPNNVNYPDIPLGYFKKNQCFLKKSPLNS